MTNRRRSDQHTPLHSCRRTQCMQTHIQHSDAHITCTQTPSVTTYIFPLLSSLILEFITEKAHPCFLLFKPDVSSSSLPLFSLSLLSRPLLFIVLWSGEFIFFFRLVYVCVRVLKLNPNFPLFLCRGRHTNRAVKLFPYTLLRMFTLLSLYFSYTILYILITGLLLITLVLLAVQNHTPNMKYSIIKSPKVLSTTILSTV